MSLKKHRRRASEKRRLLSLTKIAHAQARQEILCELLEQGRSIFAEHSRKVGMRDPMSRDLEMVETIVTVAQPVYGPYPPDQDHIDAQAADMMARHIIKMGYMHRSSEQHPSCRVVVHAYRMFIGREER